MPTKVTAVLSVALLAAASLTACSGGGGEQSSTSNEITVWTEENLEDRMAVQNAIVAEFTQKTGIKVKLVGVAEDQFRDRKSVV